MKKLHIGMWALALVFLIIIICDQLTGGLVPKRIIEINEAYRHFIRALG